jgi:anti-sigma factor RsiW
MTCNEIESRLPAYLEHLLSPDEKETIEGHLASCAHCSRACEAIRKTQGIVKNLPEVEPPPFFEQRIMSGVQEEAAQKQGILRKLFYPLYIKVPIQAFATLLVAVMAFSIYRTVMLELKDLAPPAITAPEPAKEQTTAESIKAPAAPVAVTPVMKAPAKDLPDKKKQGFAAAPIEHGARADRMAGSSSPPQEERASMAKPAVPAMAVREKESPELPAEALSRIQDRAGKQEAAQSFEAPLPKHTRKGKMAHIGAAPAPSQATDAAIQRPAVYLTIHVKNVPVAVREIEERLGQVNGRVIERQRRDARELVKAEVAVQNLAAFLHGIEAIGRIKVEKSPRDLSNGTVAVNIQITGEP